MTMKCVYKKVNILGNISYLTFIWDCLELTYSKTIWFKINNNHFKCQFYIIWKIHVFAQIGIEKCQKYFILFYFIH